MGIDVNPGALRIAPANLLVRDYGKFVDQHGPKIGISRDNGVFDPLVCLTILGHAQNSHCEFRGRVPYKDTSIIDVIKALSIEENIPVTEKIRAQTSYHLHSAYETLETLVEIVSGKIQARDSNLYNQRLKSLVLRDPVIDEDRPLFGFNLFKPTRYQIKSPKHFLIGAYIASQMDSEEWRKKTMEMFPKKLNGVALKIGNGKCHVGDVEAMRYYGLSSEILSEMEYDERGIEKLFSDGVLINVEPRAREFKRGLKYADKKENKNHINVFLRNLQGKGCCDDATMLGAALQFRDKGFDIARDVFYGAILVDTIDTLDKVSAIPITGGADEFIGKVINRRMREFIGQDIATEEQICKAIYFGAKNNSPSLGFSNSVRRFHQGAYVQSTNESMTPIQAHELYLRTLQITPGISLGFEGTQSAKFYRVTNKRLGKMQDMGIMPQFEPEEYKY